MPRLTSRIEADNIVLRADNCGELRASRCNQIYPRPAWTAWIDEDGPTVGRGVMGDT
jgi:hypothetical protein